MNIVFEGGGFPAFWYGLGYGMKFLDTDRPAFFAGYSAGALVATLLTSAAFSPLPGRKPLNASCFLKSSERRAGDFGCRIARRAINCTR